MKHLLPVIGIILLCLSATNSSAQFEVTFDDSDLLLPGPCMDYTHTIDTGDYQFRIDEKEHVRSLDASDWPPGIYLVRITERKGDRSAALSFYRKP